MNIPYMEWILWGTDRVNGHALLWFTSIRGLFILQVSSLGSCPSKEKNAPSHNLGRIRNLETRSQVYDMYILLWPPPRMPVTTKGLGWNPRAKKKKSAVILVVTGILPGRGLHPRCLGFQLPKRHHVPWSKVAFFLGDGRPNIPPLILIMGI